MGVVDVKRKILPREKLPNIPDHGEGMASSGHRDYDYLEWIARLTSHIPDRGTQLVHYYGAYLFPKIRSTISRRYSKISSTRFPTSNRWARMPNGPPGSR